MSNLNYQLSFWEHETFFKNTDALVLGSGIVGLSAAIFLKKKHPDWRVLVVERGSLPIGASTRNAGFACFGSLTELLDDLENSDEDTVLGVVERRWRGLQLLRSLVGDSNLSYENLGGYEMFTHADAEVFEKCQAAMPYFNDKIGRITGQKQVYSTVDERLKNFGFRGVEHLVLNQAEGQIHTGRMMKNLLQLAQSQGVEILNGIEIRHFEDSPDGVRLETSAGWQIHSQRMLVAVNGFAKQFFPELDIYPARNQVLVTRPVAGLRVAGCFHYDRGYFYFRNIEGRVLLGGGRNLDFEREKTTDFGQTERIQNALVGLLGEVILPDQTFEIERWWSGIMGLGSVKKPIVERVSARVAVAVRMSGMGVAIGTLVGKEGALLLDF